MDISSVYFSPTGSTKRIVRIISGDLSPDTAEIDITLGDCTAAFDDKDTVIFGIPVYSGRVPRLAGEKIERITGNSSKAILVASYGNRHYDDSLLELKTIVQSNGFNVIAAAAFVSEHNVVEKFGKGRPDENDLKEIHSFAQLIKQKLSSEDGISADLPISGNPNYREYKSVAIKPHTNSRCTKCGLCAKNCPAGAIPISEPDKTEKEKCVTCIRCIRICPKKARGFYAYEKFFAEKGLEKRCSEYRKPEIFI